MDLIYTNAKKVDQGVLSAYAFDLSFGVEENDFEMTLGASEPTIESGAFVYIEGTEYGGTVDGLRASTNGDTITYTGRTWHGILNSKVIEPDEGADYFAVSGDANAVIAALIERLALGSLFKAVSDEAGIGISSYQFHRYCKAYDGLRAMLAENGAKLKIEWKDRAVYLSAVPVTDYTDWPVDGDIATLTVEQHTKKVNHLICLGKGDLAEREVIHLYVDQFGRIGATPYYTGLDDISEVYDNNSTEDLLFDGLVHLIELIDNDIAEIALDESAGLTFDIGDIVPATERRAGVTVTAAVSQKIVKINNGTVSTEYKTGS